MTSTEQRFEGMEKDLIQLVLIEIMEISLLEMVANDDAAIVKQIKYYNQN